MAAAKRTYGRIGLGALALVFIAGVSLSNTVLRGFRADLTENDLYTLSAGTVRIVGGIAEPLNLYLFFSDRATASVPYLRTYAARVREMLEDFAARSGGKLRLTVIDPLPFSEGEDRATEFGLQPIRLGNSIEPIYFGVAGSNSVGDDEIIPFLDPAREAFLEYELAKLVYTLANPRKPVIGLLSSLPMTAGFDPLNPQASQPWVITRQIRQFFEVRSLDAAIERIDDDIRVLVLVHPRGLPDTALYAIDQFVLGGGRLLAFIDPHAEMDPGDPANPAAQFGGKASQLDRLLEAWGVRIDTANAVIDDRYALTVSGGDGLPLRHLGVIGLDDQAMDPDDVITAGLGMVNMAFPGHITRTTAAGPEFAPLIRSSGSAALIGTERLLFAADPAGLREGFAPAGEPFVLAARLGGTPQSAFPGGLPAPPGSQDDAPAGHLAEARAPVNIVLVADSDMLSDRLWVQSRDFFGQRVDTAFANNGDFVINALDNLLGSSDLISIRSRATFSRPFHRVEDLRRRAEARFLVTEQRLQEELQETDNRLAELQANRTDRGGAILTAEQQTEIARFQARRLELRRELRQVQRGLDESIERLGMRLKLINIGGVPLLIVLGGLVALWQRRRRAAHAR